MVGHSPVLFMFLPTPQLQFAPASLCLHHVSVPPYLQRAHSPAFLMWKPALSLG